MKIDIIKILKMIKDKGFFEVVLSTTMVKALMFLSAMFLPRFLNIGDYAKLTYAETLINYFLLISGMGMSSALLKYCSEKNVSEERKKGYYISTTVIGTCFNVLISIIFILIIQNINLKIKGTNTIAILMLGIPFVSYIFQNIQYFLRALFKNKAYANLTLFYTILYVGLQILLAIKIGINGVIIARYFAYVFCIFCGLLCIKKYLKIKTEWPKTGEYREIIVFSATLLGGSFFSTALINNEVFLIGSFFNETYLANYKVASYVLQICVFFVEAIMIFAIPYFSRHAKEKKWIWKNFKKIFILNLVLMTGVVVFLSVISKYLVLFIFGEKYLNSIKIIYILLLAAYAQTVLRAIPGNILAFVGGEKYTLGINTVTCLIHIVIDVILFRILGERVAGVGLIIAYTFSGICMIVKLRSLCNEGNK